MITIYEIQKYLEKKLNKLGNEELFKVYYWAKNYDKAYLESGKGFYIQGQEEPQTFPDNKQYILSRIVDYDGSYEPIPDILISNQSFSLDFYFPTEKTENIKYILNDLSLSLKGEIANLIDESGKGFRVIFKADVPTYLDASVQHLNDLCGFDDRFSFERTKEYTIAEIKIYFTFTEDVIMGNDLSYLVSWNNGQSDTGLTIIRPINNDLGNSTETDGEQELGKKTTDHVSKKNDSTFQIQFYAESTNKLCNKLFKRIFYGVGQDDVFSISTGGFGTETYGVECLITDVSFNASIGKFGMFTLTLKRSDS